MAKRTNPGVTERGFAQWIAARYSPLRLFTLNFAPRLVRTRIRPRMKPFELIYALPYLVLRREIAHSFKSSTLSSPVTRSWHIAFELALTLKFTLTRPPHLVATLERASRAMREGESNLALNRITRVQTISSSSKASALQLQPWITPMSASISGKNHLRYYIPRTLSTPVSDLAPGGAVYPLDAQLGTAYSAPFSNLYSRGSARIAPLTAPDAQRLAKDAGDARLAAATEFDRPPKQELAAAEPGSMATNYPLVGTPLRAPAVSALENALMSSHVREFRPTTPYVRWLTPNHKRSPPSEGRRMIPLYHSYPRLEHHTSVRTEVLKERVVEKVSEKPPQVTPQPPSIDVNRLADQVYHFIERRVRIERERRGL